MSSVTDGVCEKTLDPGYVRGTEDQLSRTGGWRAGMQDGAGQIRGAPPRDEDLSSTPSLHTFVLIVMSLIPQKEGRNFYPARSAGTTSSCEISRMGLTVGRSLKL